MSLVSRIRSYTAVTAVALLAFSCKKPQPYQIPGPYNRFRTQGQEWLDLLTNGTFVQVYSNAALARTNAGRWAFQPEPPTLVLKGALVIDDSPGHPTAFTVTNAWKLKTRRLAGLILFEDPDKEPFAQVTPENQ